VACEEPWTPPAIPGPCDPACPDGERCAAGECVPDCDLGDEGCGCRDDGSCDGELACRFGFCSAPGCASGALGCDCRDDGSCAPGALDETIVCSPDDVCVPEDDSESPGQPSTECFSPCEQSFIGPNGEFRHCNGENLMEGCLGLQVCVMGTCVDEGEQPPGCADHGECAQHQLCIQGHCLSNCDEDGDCASEGDRCVENICRRSCEAADSLCPDGFRCATLDGQVGVCRPVAGDAVVDEPIDGPPIGNDSYSLSTGIVRLNNTRNRASFDITNESDRALTFTIEKVDHTVTGESGSQTITIEPLWWTTLGVYVAVPPGDAGVSVPSVPELEVSEPSIEVEVLPGESRSVFVGEADNENLSRWEGHLRVRALGVRPEVVLLEYSERPDGEWAGTIHNFISFDDTEIDVWRSAMRTGTRSEKLAAARATQNALLVQYTEFRTNPLYGLDRLDAVVAATTGQRPTWSLPGTQSLCDEQFAGTTETTCYLLPGGEGGGFLGIYSDTATIRPPSGEVAMPFVMRLQQDPDDTSALAGRIESGRALQYGGMPAVELGFDLDEDQGCEDDEAAACIVPVNRFTSTIVVGARYVPADGEACAAGFALAEVPWYPVEFVEGTVEAQAGGRVRRECRETTFPAGPAEANAAERNKSLAGANPLPDGRRRVRTLELLDGMLIDQQQLFLFVRERFSANLDRPESEGQPADFTTYGLIKLRRVGADLERNPYTPGIAPAPIAPEDEQSGRLLVGCSEELLDELLPGEALAGNEGRVAQLILYGHDNTELFAEPASRVHWLCHDTGRFDGGLRAWEDEGGEACPLSSGVTYFLMDEPFAGYLQDDPCQQGEAGRCTCIAGGAGEAGCVDVDCGDVDTGNCASRLAELEVLGEAELGLRDLCADEDGELDPDEVVCPPENRFDLRVGKVFFDPTPGNGGVTQVVVQPLASLISTAFRYKTRFQSRSGQSVGFVPDICAFESDVLPYCYAPDEIDEARARVDCLVDLFASGSLDAATIGAEPLAPLVEDFLVEAFSFGVDESFTPPRSRDGFERYYSELLIMLGDEAVTQARASRFDLAGSQVAGFRGDLVEPGGAQLSGGAGYEMILLYRAQQYYQLVIDRFARLTPTLWTGLGGEQAHNFLTLDSIATYFNRVILASTKKAQVAEEVANRYQALGRADLARHVIERAFTEAYLESITISQLMRESSVVLEATEADALRVELESAQRGFRQAFAGMRDNYSAITDLVTFFGDAPDFIPFPAPNQYEQTAVRVMLDRAFATLELAKTREDRALMSNRQFDVDAAQFQSELSRIRQQYEGELADICGEVVGTDGLTYPAINAYADLVPAAAALPDPCGYVGNGQIHDAIAELETDALDLRAEVQDIRDIQARVAIEEERVAQECMGRVSIADTRVNVDDGYISLQNEIDDQNQEIARWERKLSVADRIAQVANGVSATASAFQAGAQCPAWNVVCINAGGVAVISAGLATAAQGAGLAMQLIANDDIDESETRIQRAQRKIDSMNRDFEYNAAVQECCLDWAQDTAGGGPANPDAGPVGTCDHPGPLLVNSQAQIEDRLVDLLRAEIEALRAEIELQRAAGRLESLRLKAQRLQAQHQETQQHLINVEAARNDPNVRIYANADVNDADVAFEDGLVDAFRATRVFEYYTAQSYAPKEFLFQVRMAGRGDNNLENYLVDLQRAFNDFENTFGRPDPRVLVVSLRDDIFGVARNETGGDASRRDTRAQSLADRLRDPSLLDDNGYIRVPFSTSLAQTSPLTSIHRVQAVEVELQGGGVGDRFGRVYLTARGIATVRDLNGDVGYHRLSPLTAVVNPFFNGVKVFDPPVYANRRLLDRPLVNSLWELTLNLKDEEVNEDIDLSRLEDVRIFFFYEDFTQL
jgi:hypothetical protein